MQSQPPTRRERIKTPDAPAAIGPYCQGLLVGETLYVSGQIALDPKTGDMVEGDVQDETAQILDNVGAVLRAADMDFAHVVQVTLFLREMDDYAPVNEVYARYFSGATPAREALEVGKLPREARVEISCIAVR
ncbi:RidA family protein [Rubrivirga marina]|uniref:Reactive intermediate/imine deaminase n=1 Tax=Rubrivirga marina TaxID=1196024 RepID=A0A271IY81_9BACT|nr:RidA family protein [Rubrivirga marina]PAP76211.1 reactive intermediate/imine deaminase [Rubrivirga marina]